MKIISTQLIKTTIYPCFVTGPEFMYIPFNAGSFPNVKLQNFIKQKNKERIITPNTYCVCDL